MMRSSLLVLALAVSTVAAPARAQAVPETTADADAARAQKASSPGSHESDSLVRLLDFVEQKAVSARNALVGARKKV